MIYGYLCLILHLHLPYVKNINKKEDLAEEWLYEAITESYLPLLNLINRLIDKNIDFKITISLSPTLMEMFSDKTLQKRYKKYLKRLISLGEREIKRTKLNPKKNKLAKLYYENFKKSYNLFHYKYKDNILNGFRKIDQNENIELITTAATHGYLPLIFTDEGKEAQIKIGRKSFYNYFGKYPDGFWLPECAFKPSFTKLLAKNNIKYTILSTNGLMFSKPQPINGCYAPIDSKLGVNYFGRDRKTSKLVWSSKEGYPGDFNYREFYRDIAYDLDYEYLKPYLPQGIRKDTGYKYYKITSKNENKNIYDYYTAKQKATEHAEDFLNKIRKSCFYLNQIMNKPPIIVSPYDGELFGHWWFEGPIWLESLFEKLDKDFPFIKAISPGEYLKFYSDNQKACPTESSWGYNGYHEVWLNKENDWIYRHLHEAELIMKKLSTKFSKNLYSIKEKNIINRKLKQMARELLLAQSSDWAFIMKTKTMDDYAKTRVKNHLKNFFLLTKDLNSNKKIKLLEKIEKENDIFPYLKFDIYSSKNKKDLRKEG